MAVACPAFVLFSAHRIELSNTLKNAYLIGLVYPALYNVLPLILLMLGSLRRRRKTANAA